jgi:Zn-finger nucleic acid-binding protein
LRLTENEESSRCEYCGTVYTPPRNDDGVRLLGESSKLACPVCAIPLESAALAGHRILSCTKCLGMLVSMNVFVALIEELRAAQQGRGSVQPAADRKSLERCIDCPQCHQRMDTHFYEGPGNIVIDDCSRCFLNWLDQGEMTRVARAPDHLYTENSYRRTER